MKKHLFILSAATLMLAACGGGSGNDRAAIPSTEQGVVDKVAVSAILINTDGKVLSTEKPNELAYGKILNPAISFKIKAHIAGVTDKDPTADKEGNAYVTADLKWTFDANWKIYDSAEDKPDEAHIKVKGTYPKAGEAVITSKATVKITFGQASKEVSYTLLMQPRS